MNQLCIAFAGVVRRFFFSSLFFSSLRFTQKFDGYFGLVGGCARLRRRYNDLKVDSVGVLRIWSSEDKVGAESSSDFAGVSLFRSLALGGQLLNRHRWWRRQPGLKVWSRAMVFCAEEPLKEFFRLRLVWGRSQIWKVYFRRRPKSDHSEAWYGSLIPLAMVWTVAGSSSLHRHLFYAS